MHGMPENQASSLDRTALGIRLREIRRHARITIRQAAERAGLDKNTVLAIEQGRTVRQASLAKLAAIYGVLPVIPRAESNPRDPDAVLHHPDDDVWFRIVADQLEEPSHLSTVPAVQDPANRLRLGKAGLADQFFRRLECHRPNGKIRAAFFETYSTSGWSVQPSGEALYYVVAGTLLFTLRREGQEPQTLVFPATGAITIDRTVPHMHGPAPGSPLPLQFLYVQVD